MKKARKEQINRCFGKCPKNSDQQNGEKVKKILPSIAERRKADRAIGDVRRQFRGRYSLLQILPLLERRYPLLLTRAIERIEGQKARDELSFEEIIFFETFKASLSREE